MYRFALWLLLTSTGLTANNLAVTQVTLQPQDPTTSLVEINFNIQWDNSWRINGGPCNWDAAWVFVKYQLNGGSWQHATISQAVTTPAGGVVEVPADQRGAFVYRSAAGSGSVNYQNVGIGWDYDRDVPGEGDQVVVRLYAVEMVYVPEGAYRLGTGGGEAHAFYAVPNSGTARPAYVVSSEAAIAVGSAAGQLLYDPATLDPETGEPSSFPGDRAGPVPAAFPKGFAAFYCMKYEVTQQQYVEFFNSLEASQQSFLDLTGPDGKNSDAVVERNAVSWSGSGNAALTSLPLIPVGYLSAYQSLSYLDWAGLRPMTELEFEKACRGADAAVVDEYAWGSNQLYANAYTLANTGGANEGVSNTDINSATVGNLLYATTSTNVGGPLRGGAFAASTTIGGRPATGGSYYGIMDLSGNVSELVVSVGDAAGRAFTAKHGDGSLTVEGHHDVATWPGPGEGTGIRGGDYKYGDADCKVSNRTYVLFNYSAGGEVGLRGVRSVNPVL